MTSWRSLQDPSTGDYTYTLDPRGLPQTVLDKGPGIEYRSGPSDDVRFGGGPPLQENAVFTPVFIFNSTFVYYSFVNNENTAFSRFVVNQSGLLQYLTWNQRRSEWVDIATLQSDKCDAYDQCGPNGFCSANEPPLCSCPTGFIPKLPQDWNELDSSAEYGNDIRAVVIILVSVVSGVLFVVVICFAGWRRASKQAKDQSRGTSLDWQKRFNIIAGIARGLLYLHRDSRLRIIHRDLEASNILLDDDMNPKISNFGLARTFGGNQSEANTSRVMGTYGHMSLEYALDGLFSVKSDVFSFGVLVLEIGWRLWIEERPTELMDALMEKPVSTSELLKSIHVGLLCVQQQPEDRPTMSSVVMTLDSENPVLHQPKQPGFYRERFLTDRFIIHRKKVL
ncbi:hypothetical protein GH714_001270 [Hevea brasiliensis]|uniref:Protein kinase domain-containing protein n=1 Tax=Hevea brasiliensis TaxID=3981 RepID=A0A6A6LZB6_HEVBR|nr:hypothetical protein GH714_001270 [Hevea brasiliensis]